MHRISHLYSRCWALRWSGIIVLIVGYLLHLIYRSYAMIHPLLSPLPPESNLHLLPSTPPILPSRLNESKVALLIENRPSAVLAPLMLHFISVVPPDWHFRFMGSHESIAAINRSVAVRHHVRSGKLALTRIPSNMSTAGQEMISRFLTSLWLYESVLRPAEWLLLFQTDSMICANSRLDVNDFLEYDWVGAPWNPGGRWGGNGGLSLRRVSRIIDILRNQERPHDSEPEDVWLSERLAHHPNGNVANGSISLLFSGEVNSGMPEHVPRPSNMTTNATAASQAGTTSTDDEYVQGIDDWRDGFYEPMGYHTGGSGAYLHSGIWGTPRQRSHIWKYCPEIKMTLAMDAAQYIPGNCASRWTRGIHVVDDDDDLPEEGILEE